MLMVKPIPSFGRQLRRLRLAAGLSQQALAGQAGLAISVVTAIEQGQRGDPRLSTAVALARALNVTVDELCAEEAEGQPEEEKPAPKKGRQKK